MRSKSGNIFTHEPVEIKGEGILLKVTSPVIVKFLKSLKMDCEDKKIKKKSCVIIAA